MIEKVYSESKQLNERYYKRRGKMVGLYVKQDIISGVASVSCMKDGLHHGEFKSYDSRGLLINHHFYKADRLIFDQGRHKYSDWALLRFKLINHVPEINDLSYKNIQWWAETFEETITHVNKTGDSS